MKINLIAAMSTNRVIGKDNRLPWHLPEDLKRLRQLTMGHPVIMGRKTYESVGHPLSGRQNIIVTRQKGYTVEGATIRGSLKNAFALLYDCNDKVFVLGGEQVYRHAMSRADRIYLTVIHEQIEGDAFFPLIPKDQFVEIERKDFFASKQFSFLIYDRR